MEAISGKNFEIWFVDYLDGRLDDRRLSQLMDFLEENPHLKEELEGIAGFSLVNPTEVFPCKDSLLKTLTDVPGISSDDQLCIARMENDMTPADAEVFDGRLTEDPLLSGLFSSFQATRLTPEPIVFKDKSTLLHKARVFRPWLLTALSASAVIAVALVLWPREENPVAGLAVKTETTDIKPKATEAVRPLIAETRVPVKTVSAVRQPAKPEIKEKVEPVAQRDFIPMTMVAYKQAGISIGIPDPTRTPVVFASVFNPLVGTGTQDDQYLTLPQYALRLFREKILGQDPGLVKKTRFSVWEVAGAGVEKINVLAGTQMKLEREYDSKGQVMAVSFNSRLFDLETPVKSPENR
jgi:hypothetical protein